MRHSRRWPTRPARHRQPPGPGRRHRERAGGAVRHVVTGRLEAPAGARAQRPDLAAARRGVPALSPRGGGAGRHASTGSVRTGASGASASTSSTRTCARCGRPRRRAGVPRAGQTQKTPRPRQGRIDVSERDELHFTRIVEAPRELVFRCMIEPEHLTHFWGPAGVSAPLERIAVDARPGGVFETVMVQRRRRERVPDARRVRRGAPARAAVWTEAGVGHAGDVGVRRARAGPDRGADPPGLRARALLRPDAQAGFLRPSTASRRISPGDCGRAAGGAPA